MTTLSELMTMHHGIMAKLAEADGELTPEIETIMVEFQEQFPAKVDAYATLDDRLDAEISYFKSLADQMSAKKRTLEGIRKNLKERVKMAFGSLDTKEVEGEYFKYKLVRSRPKLMVDEKFLDKKYKKEIVSVQVDKKMIEEDLKTGLKVTGAELVGVESLKRYIKTKIKD